LPIGLSCPVKFVVCHSRDRDTRWAFCCSRGCRCGDVKMADVRGGSSIKPLMALFQRTPKGG
jgi:hypothetical protein